MPLTKYRQLALDWLAVTGLALIHIVPIFAMSELLRFRLGQQKAKLGGVRSVINVNVADLPKVVSERKVFLDERVTVRNDVVIRVNGDHTSGCTRGGNILPFGLFEEALECTPIGVGRAIQFGIVNLEHPEGFDLQSRGFPAVPKPDSYSEWYLPVIRVVLQDLDIGDSKPSALVKFGSFDTGVQGRLGIARVFRHGGLRIIGSPSQLDYGMSGFLSDFVSTCRKAFSGSCIPAGSIGNLFSGAGLNVRSTNQFVGLNATIFGGFLDDANICNCCGGINDRKKSDCTSQPKIGLLFNGDQSVVKLRRPSHVYILELAFGVLILWLATMSILLDLIFSRATWKSFSVFCIVSVVCIVTIGHAVASLVE
jgi:hypothetical protein